MFIVSSLKKKRSASLYTSVIFPRMSQLCYSNTLILKADVFECSAVLNTVKHLHHALVPILRYDSVTRDELAGPCGEFIVL